MLGVNQSVKTSKTCVATAAFSVNCIHRLAVFSTNCHHRLAHVYWVKSILNAPHRKVSQWLLWWISYSNQFWCIWNHCLVCSHYLALVFYLLTIGTCSGGTIHRGRDVTVRSNVLEAWQRGSCKLMYRKISNIRRTKFQNISDSRPVLQLSLLNLLKPCIKSRMKM